MNIDEYRRKRNGKSVGNISQIKNYLKKFISRVLIVIIIFLIGLIVTKNNATIKEFINKNIYTNNLKFTKIKNFYNKYFGKYIGESTKTKEVFTEKLSYQKANIYKDGVMLTVSSNYLVPAIESGIVIFIGNKEGYGNTLIIEQVNGVDVWYSNINVKDVKMYDYVEKGALIGEVKDTKLYLLFEQDGKYLNYKKYI